MSRNLVPRIDKGADLGTQLKNWNKLYVDAVILRNRNLQTLLDGKTDLEILTNKGDLYVATNAGEVTRLPAGTDGYVLKTNSGVPEGLMWGPAGARQELTGNITVTVGDNGDFPTINAALENVVALYYPKYISGNNCPRVTINLLPGFVMNEQVLIESLDLSWITITGDDEETIINRSALNINFYATYPAFGAANGGTLPIIGQLFNMNTEGESTNKNGIVAFYLSKCIISSGYGIKNAGYYGIFANNGSIIDAYNTNISKAGYQAIYAGRCSIINADGANIAESSSGARAHIRSTINLNGANASAIPGTSVLSSENSIINASYVNASGEKNQWCYGFEVAQGSIISAYNATGTLSQTANTITSNGIIFQ